MSLGRITTIIIYYIFEPQLCARQTAKYFTTLQHIYYLHFTEVVMEAQRY